MAGKKPKSQGPKRTGLFSGAVPNFEKLEAPEDQSRYIHASFASEDRCRDEVTAFLARAEARALSSLADNGLPSWPGLLQRKPGGQWEPEAPGSEGPLERNWARCLAFEHGDSDSEIGFASRVLWAVHDTRLSLSSEPANPFSVAFHSIKVVDALRQLEFEFG